MPKISIIIPCYNVEVYLAQCLDSVLTQSLRDIEVICVDDGSTDSTPEILGSYGKKDPRIRVLSQKNQFAGVARNAGMEVAQGEYIAFLDGDDYYIPGSLEKAYATAREYDLELLKLSSYLLNEENGQVSTSELYCQAHITTKNMLINRKDHFQQLLRCRDVPWNGLYKRSFLEKHHIQFSDLCCSNDHSFFVQCIASVERAMVTEDFLTVYRQNRADSLVAVRYQNFDCQIRNYEIVRSICEHSSLTFTQRQFLMQKELNLIFLWYDKILKTGVNAFEVEEILRAFVGHYTVSDVGERYIAQFPYSHLFRHIQDSRQIQWQNHEPGQEPYFSVIMPVYNTAQYLSESIDSILLQDFSDFELICVDNASTDGSRAYLEEYSRRDRRIRILTESQAGAGIARNTGIAAARGRYLCFVDADDKIGPDYLRTLYESAEVHKAEIVVLQFSNWNDNDHITPKHQPTSEKIPPDTPFSYKDFPQYILTFTHGAPWGKTFRKDFIQRLGLKFLSLPRSEDFYFVLGALVQAERIVCHENYSYFYRMNNTNSLENRKDQFPLCFWEATLELKKLLQDLRRFPELKQSYLTSAINRFYYNLQSMRSFDGFRKLFYLFSEVCNSELELDRHSSAYYFPVEYIYERLREMLQYERAEDYLHRQYYSREREKSLQQKAVAQAFADLEQSISFRIGSTITYIPRKLKNGLSFIREHGIRRGLSYGLSKFKRVFTRSHKEG